MAQTKKKRRRKHRGTQGGRIDTRPARGRARSRAEAQNRARSRTKKKGNAGAREPQPASWSSAFKKGGVAAVLMLGFYIPMSFLMDRFFYQRYLRKEEKKRQEREARRTGGAQQPEG